MTIEGRINVDCLFHDRSGSERIKVLSLRSGSRFTSGDVVLVTGTAGTAAVSIAFNNYRDAAGNIVTLNSPFRLAFSWSGSSRRVLSDSGENAWRLISSQSEVAVTQLADSAPLPVLTQGAGTGTYSILMWGI